jgi:hypothetical protein
MNPEDNGRRIAFNLAMSKIAGRYDDESSENEEEDQGEEYQIKIFENQNVGSPQNPPVRPAQNPLYEKFQKAKKTFRTASFAGNSVTKAQPGPMPQFTQGFNFTYKNWVDLLEAPEPNMEIQAGWIISPNLHKDKIFDWFRNLDRSIIKTSIQTIEETMELLKKKLIETNERAENLRYYNWRRCERGNFDLVSEYVAQRVSKSDQRRQDKDNSTKNIDNMEPKYTKPEDKLKYKIRATVAYEIAK